MEFLNFYLNYLKITHEFQKALVYLYKATIRLYNTAFIAFIRACSITVR